MIGQGIPSYNLGRQTGHRRRAGLLAGVLSLSLGLGACATSLGPEPGSDVARTPAATGPQPSMPQGAEGPTSTRSQGPGGAAAGALGPAREDQPVPTIGLYTTTSDSVGMEIQSKLRDAIKRAGYFPSTNADRPLLGLHLLSATPGERSDAPVAYYTATWTTRDGRFITHMVGSCSLKGASECANALMVTTSQLAQMQMARESAGR